MRNPLIINDLRQGAWARGPKSLIINDLRTFFNHKKNRLSSKIKILFLCFLGLTGNVFQHRINGVMERHIDRLQYTEAYGEQGHTYTFTGPCRVTGEEYSVTVKGPELFRMRQTNSIMALKSLDSGDREFLISGTSPKGWDKLFS